MVISKQNLRIVSPGERILPLSDRSLFVTIKLDDTAFRAALARVQAGFAWLCEQFLAADLAALARWEENVAAAEALFDTACWRDEDAVK